jgi:hypothetical protein
MSKTFSRFSALALLVLALPALSVPAAAMDFVLAAKEGVSEAQQREIQSGLEFATKFFETQVGGGIPEGIARKIRVRLDLSGKGSAAEGGGAPAAMSIKNGLPRLYFDLQHPQWGQKPFTGAWTQADDNKKFIVHEYTHAWSTLLARNAGVPWWMDEGFAEYLAYSSMITAGRMKKADVDYFLAFGAQASNELSKPLRQYEQGNIWPGHVGYLAADWLVSSSSDGRESIRIFYAGRGKGQSVKKSFRNAFGLDLGKFYEAFETWRPSLSAAKSESEFANALKQRPALEK